MRMRNYKVSTPLEEFEIGLLDTSTVGEFLDWLVTSGRLHPGDALELAVRGTTVQTFHTFGMLDLPDGEELMVLASGTSV